MQGRPLSVMDICCGLGTVSLAGRELTRAVRAKHPWDNRGFAVQTRLPLQPSHATESVSLKATARQPCALCAMHHACLLPNVIPLQRSHDIRHERLFVVS